MYGMFVAALSYGLCLGLVHSAPFFVPSPDISWFDARSMCHKMGTSLMTLSDVESGATCWSDVINDERVWIGAIYDAVQGQWMWEADGTQVDLALHGVDQNENGAKLGQFYVNSNALVGSGDGQLSLQNARIRTGIVGYCCNEIGLTFTH